MGNNIDKFFQYLIRMGMAGVDKNGKAINKDSTGNLVSNETVFNKMAPTNYPNVPAGVSQLASRGGMDRTIFRDKEGDLEHWDEAYAKSLGLPHKEKYIVKSPWFPSDSKDVNSQYYKLRDDVLDPDKILRKWWLAEQGGHLEYDKKKNRYTYPAKGAYDLLRSGLIPEDEYKQVDPFENYTLGLGKDKYGDYISMFDSYDFKDSPVMEKISKPYEFYDRVYFKKDKNGDYTRVDVTPGKDDRKKEITRRINNLNKNIPKKELANQISDNTNVNSMVMPEIKKPAEQHSKKELLKVLKSMKGGKANK
jgi:hypothetical protein